MSVPRQDLEKVVVWVKFSVRGRVWEWVRIKVRDYARVRCKVCLRICHRVVLEPDFGNPSFSY